MPSIPTGNYPYLWSHRCWPPVSRHSRDKYTLEANSLSVSFLSSAADIPNELGTAGSPMPLEGPWLYKALEHGGLNAQFSFLYAIVWQVSKPIAAAPAYTMDVLMERVCPEKLLKTLKTIGRVLPSILHQRTLFVGSPGTAVSAIGILPGVNRRAVLFALQCALERKARDLNAELIIWRDMPGSVAKDLDWLTRRRRLFRAVSLPSTVLRFSSQRKSDYLEQLEPRWRRAYLRKLRRSASAVEVTTQVFQQPPRKVLDEMVGLFQQTALKAKVKFEELPPAWFERIAEIETTYFMVMREKQTGEMIAATGLFDRRPMLVARHVVFDYGKPRNWMLYFRLWDALVDWALCQGFSSILSGQVSYTAKMEVGHNLIPLFNYIWHRNAFMHAVYGNVARRLTWAKLDDGLAEFLKAHPEAEEEALKTSESDNA
jgi:hypothetical protein